MGRQFRLAAAAVALFQPGIGCADESAPPRNSMSAWTGISASAESQYAYAGTAYAFGGDIDADGPLARVGFGGGQYRTDGSDSHLVKHYDLDLMAGYRFNFSGATIALYGGGDLKHHDNDDTHANIRGRELGAKAQVEAYASLTGAIFVSGFANYSTAFDSFNVSGKLGYRASDVLSIGPESSVLGTTGFDQVRAGLASAYWIGDRTELAPSAGAAWDFEESDYSFYAGINLYSKF